MKIMFGYRGDNRDAQAIEASGGFVPKYLLQHHNGGFQGFLACNNKVDRRIGCSCANMQPADLFLRSRQKLQEIVRNPMLLQEHVMYNRLGYLSTATAKDDAYQTAHKYKIFAEFEVVYTMADARVALGINGGRQINQIAAGFKIMMNSRNLNHATLIAATPHQGVELTFISPVEYRYISEF